MSENLKQSHANSRIPAKSRRQAMDWSLALVSQGIDTVIESPDQGTGWGLVVSAQDAERAFKTLRQYHAENREWPWRRELPWTETHFDWGSVAWVALLILFYGLSSRDPDFVNGGIMDSARVAAGQWWRVFTAMMLHADLGHLAENLAIGIVLFGLAMARYGTGTGLLAAYLAGAGGNLVSLQLNAKPFHGLGASGMVMGALGLLAAQSLFPETRRRTSLKQTLAGVAAGVMLFVLFGVTPGTDIAAHFGGFVTGLLLGATLCWLPPKWSRSSKPNFLSGAFLAALVTMTWWLALIRR
jgi:rhomboid protease GluP